MALKTLDRYVMRSVLGPLALALVVLLMVLSLERLLRLLEIVEGQDGAAIKLFELLFYLMPHYLGLAIPAALFLAVIIGVRRLLDSSELAVMQSTGISLRHLFKPVYMIAGPLTLLMVFLAAYAQPYARYEYRQSLHMIASGNPLAGARAGSFIDINDRTVLKFDEINTDEGIITGVFISRDKASPPQMIVIGAKAARLVRDSQTGQLALNLEEGNLLRENLRSGKISMLEFDVYPWPVPGALGEAYGPRGDDEREMTLAELLRGYVEGGAEPETSPEALNTELHARLVHALSLLFLALWGVPLALLGRGRTGQAVGLVIGVALLVLTEKLLGLFEAYAAQGLIHPAPALWGVFGAMTIGGWLYMQRIMPEGGKPREVAA